MECLTFCDLPGRPCPADAPSAIPPALDQLPEQPDVGPGEVPCLLERLAQVPDPRDPRGVRHVLAFVLALTACAVLAGATSLLAVGEWIADVPPHVRRGHLRFGRPVGVYRDTSARAERTFSDLRR